MLEDKAWHSSGSAVAVALLNKGGKPCSPRLAPGPAEIISHIGSGRSPTYWDGDRTGHFLRPWARGGTLVPMEV